MLSVVSIKYHSSSEQRGEDQNRPDRQALRGLRRRDSEQADLGRRIEAEAEQHA